MDEYGYHLKFPAAASRPTFFEYKNWLNRNDRITPAVSEALVLAQSVLDSGWIICYIAGALTEASDEDKHRYVRVSKVLQRQRFREYFFGYAPHINGTDPKKHPDVTPDEVRDIDYLWAVVLPDMHVNFLFPLAHGNAIEEGWGEAAHIPTVSCAPSSMRLSRLPRGMQNIDTLISYENNEDAYGQILAFFNAMHTWMVTNPDKKIISFFGERARQRGEIVFSN